METKVVAVNIADIPNPKTGKTWREENMEKTHNIPCGSLVEVLGFDDEDEQTDEPHGGLRLWVVRHDRDCDGTPLYGLSFKKNWKEEEGYFGDISMKLLSRMKLTTGFNEKSLKLIK